MAVGDELKGTALRKDRSLIIDGAILETEEQARGNPIAADHLEEITHRKHAALFRAQCEKAVNGSLQVAHGDGFRWRSRLQSTDQHRDACPATETLSRRPFHAFYDEYSPSKCLPPKKATLVLVKSVSDDASLVEIRPGNGLHPSDDCAESNIDALTGGSDSNGDLPACGDGMRQCRSLPYSRVLESYDLDPATEKGVPLFQPIERGVQIRDNRVGLIGDDDQFDVDLFV
jgi:hypothetical protein